MSLKLADVLNDPLVKETMQSLSGLDTLEIDQSFVDRDPVLKTLATTGDLDAVTAALVIADEMTFTIENRDWVSRLPKQVGDVMTSLPLVGATDAELSAYITKSVSEGQPTMFKLAIAGFSDYYAGTTLPYDGLFITAGDVREKVKQDADSVKMLVEKVSDAGLRKNLSAGLIDKFVAGVENHIRFIEDKTVAQSETVLLQALKTEIAKDAGREVTAEAVVAAPAVKPVAPKPVAPN